MRDSIKRLVAGAALLCSGIGQAAVVPADGQTIYKGAVVNATATWSFSRQLAGALSTAFPGPDVGVYGGAWQEYVYYPALDEFGEPYEYGADVIHAQVSVVTFDDVGVKVEAAASKGGTTLVLPKSTALKMGGGQAQIGELDARLQVDGSVNIYGAINGQALGAASAVSYTGLLFTVQAADVEGPLSFSYQFGGSLQATFNNLALSQAGFSALTQSFGLHPTGLMYTALQFAQPDFGDLTLTVTAIPLIPEPSSGVLMGGGLLCLVALRRRRAT